MCVSKVSYLKFAMAVFILYSPTYVGRLNAFIKKIDIDLLYSAL